MFTKLQTKDLKTEDRVNAFVDKFDGKQDFTKVDGKTIKIKNIKFQGETFIPKKSGELRSLLLTLLGDFGSRDLQISVTGGNINIGALAKVPEFGGQGKAQTGKITTGGVVTEVLSEVGFCFYYALHVNKQLDTYSVDSWLSVKNTADFQKLCNQYKGVSKMLSYQFNDIKDMDSQLSKMHAFLTTEKFDPIIRRQVKKFKQTYPTVGTNYYIARPSALPDKISPYTAYNNIAESLKGYIGMSRKIGPDKWNPADFWIFSRKGLQLLEQWNEKSKRLKSINSETYSSSYMNLVNRQLVKLYKSGDVYPVSLKKSGSSVQIKEINLGRNELEQTLEYDKVLLASTNQDVQIFYKIKTYDDGKMVTSKSYYAKMKTLSGGFRLELYETGKNTMARHGSIGVGLQNFIIYNTDRTGIGELQKVRDEFKDDDLYISLPSKGSKDWMGVNQYSKMGKAAEDLLPYVNRMMEEINGEDSAFKAEKFKGGGRPLAIATKAGAGEIAMAITKILNRNSRDITIENLHLAAGSGGVQVGASPQQIAARAKYLGMTDDDLVLPVDMPSYDAILGAGFHLKIT